MKMKVRNESRHSRDRRIIQRYLDGEPITAIGTAEGVNEKTVRNVARRANLPLRRPPRTERNARILARYSQGEPVVQIASDEGVRSQYISTLATKTGLGPRRGWQRRYPLDEEAFRRPNAVGWWLIGLLAADGCVSAGEHRVSLAQREEDIDVLHAFLSYVGSPERPLTELVWRTKRPDWCRSDGRYFEARVFSRSICDALARHGVVPRKTDGMVFSEAAASEPAVWLGLFDGDGSAGAHRHHGGTPRIDFFGLPSVMQQCSDFWASRLTLQTGRPPAVVHHRGNLHAVRLYGANAARAARALLAASPVSLNRKRRVLEEIANFVPRRRMTAA